MKLENVDGVQYIILEENDKIKITTENSHEDRALNVECQNNGLNISGSSSLINSINGDGMLEKVYIQPTLSADEIIDKCDQWIEMFKKVHDKFRELVLTDRYRKHNITMDLSFYTFSSHSQSKIVKGRNIDINLMQYNTIIQEGVVVSIDEVNEDIYKYLLANVLDYYLSINYEGILINNMDINWDQTLYSSTEKQENSTIPMICGLSCLYESREYERIVTSIITNHNLNQSSKQIIDNLRQAIYNQQVSARFNNSINYSSKQYEHIISDSEDAPSLSKKNN